MEKEYKGELSKEELEKVAGGDCDGGYNPAFTAIQTYYPSDYAHELVNAIGDVIDGNISREEGRRLFARHGLNFDCFYNYFVYGSAFGENPYI